MTKNNKTRALIATVAIISVLVRGIEVIDSISIKKENENLKMKIETLEQEKLQTNHEEETDEEKEYTIPKQENQIPDEKTNQETLDNPQEKIEDDIVLNSLPPEPEKTEETEQNNYYDINELRIIEKTYSDGNTKKSLVVSSKESTVKGTELNDIPSLSNKEYNKQKTNLYSIINGTQVGSIEEIYLQNSTDKNLYVKYSKIEYDGYTTEIREITIPSLEDYSYVENTDNVELKIYTLKEILDDSLVKTKYTLEDLLKIIIELDGKVQDKIENFIENKLIKRPN